jgi:hypothetical protein
MTYRIAGHVFFGSRITAVLVAAGVSAASGCASQTVEEAVPSGARGPINTGTFPNLNIPPKPAADQLSPSQSQADTAALRAAQQQNAAAAAAPSDQADPVLLRKLAASHAEEALKEIEQ